MGRKKTDNSGELAIIKRLREEAEISLRHALKDYGPILKRGAEMAAIFQPMQKQFQHMAENIAPLLPTFQMVARITADYQKILDSASQEPIHLLYVAPLNRHDIAEMAAFDLIDRTKSPTEADIEVALVINGTGLQFRGSDREIPINNFREGMVPHQLFRYLIYQHPNTLIGKARFTQDTNTPIKRGFSETVRKAKVTGLLKRTFIPICTEGRIQLTPNTKVDSEIYQALLDQASKSVSATA
jgi:hypothetical protein